MSSAEHIAQLAYIRPLPGREQEVEEHVTRLVEAARDEEGTLVYAAHRRVNSEGGTEFVFYELFADIAALKTHGSNAALAAFAGKAGELLDGGIKVEKLELVVGKTP